MDATAYLLERSGDLLGAFKLIREVSRNPAAVYCPTARVTRPPAATAAPHH